MKRNLFFTIVTGVGTLAGVGHFLQEPAFLAGRAWDAVMGACIFGNGIVCILNASEVIREMLDAEDGDRYPLEEGQSQIDPRTGDWSESQ